MMTTALSMVRICWPVGPYRGSVEWYVAAVITQSWLLSLDDCERPPGPVRVAVVPAPGVFDGGSSTTTGRAGSVMSGQDSIGVGCSPVNRDSPVAAPLPGNMTG